MEIDPSEVKKIIEQEVKPNENLIVWSDAYIKGVRRTYDEQVLVHNVDPELAKERIVAYIADRLSTELRPPA
jgi:hypothetical protein